MQQTSVERTPPLERLIGENPALQSWRDGTPANCSVSPEVLRFIHRHVEPGMRTLETGAGQTTVAFAAAGAEHVCISPNPRGEGIPEALDFVFLDGAHRFPFACLDWHYTESRLRVGGIVGVDDYTMPSVRVLHDFLRGEDEWELMEVLGRTSFFRRLRETVVVNDCQGQKMNQVPY